MSVLRVAFNYHQSHSEPSYPFSSLDAVRVHRLQKAGGLLSICFLKQRTVLWKSVSIACVWWMLAFVLHELLFTVFGAFVIGSRPTAINGRILNRILLVSRDRVARFSDRLRKSSWFLSACCQSTGTFTVSRLWRGRCSGPLYLMSLRFDKWTKSADKTRWWFIISSSLLNLALIDLAARFHVVFTAPCVALGLSSQRHPCWFNLVNGGSKRFALETRPTPCTIGIAVADETYWSSCPRTRNWCKILLVLMRRWYLAKLLWNLWFLIDFH